MLDLARSESWNKEASLCCLLCPGVLAWGAWGLRKARESGFFPPGDHLVIVCPSHQTFQMARALPSPCLLAHGAGTSDFMKCSGATCILLL